MTKISGTSMVRVLPALFLFIFFTIAVGDLAAQDKVFFQVDPGAHTSEITDIAVTKNSAYAITGSLDKTVRVWDLSLRRESRQILGETGEGSFGKVLALALSPDDQILASGGIFGPDGSASAGDVRLYDFTSGTLKRRLTGSTSPVTDLAFLSDGSYLAAGRADGTITVWDCKNGYAVYHTFVDAGNKGKARSIALFKNQDVVCLVAAIGGNLVLYSVTAKETIGKKELDDPVYSVSVDEKNKRIVVALQFNVRSAALYLYNYRLEQKGFYDSETENEDMFVAICPDAAFILAASKAGDSRAVLFYNDVKSRKYMAFPEIEGVSAIAFADSSRAIIAGGSENALYLWDFVKGEEFLLAKCSPSIRDIAVESDSLYVDFGMENARFTFNLIFGMKDARVTDITSNDQMGYYSRIAYKYQDYTIDRDSILKDSKVFATMELGFEYSSLFPSGFTPSGAIVSGGPGGMLSAFNKYGKKTADFSGHTGNIYALAVYGSTLISAGEDRVINFWNLEQLDQGAKTIFPYLSLYISPAGEWVYWSRSGYYMSSVHGDSFVKFHVNRGPDAAAMRYSFERFYETYYHPDVIRKIIELKSEERALQALGMPAGTGAAGATSILPPQVSFPGIQGQSLQSDREDIQVTFRVTSPAGLPVTGITVIVNGKTIQTPAADKGTTDTYTVRVPLLTETNVLYVKAGNARAVSNPAQIVIFRSKAVVAAPKPDLFIFSVGITSYNDQTLNLRFADKDAQSVAQLFESQRGKVYGQVEKRVLVNKDATRKNIEGGLAWLKEKAGQEDAIVIFLAGHGINDSRGNYYFLPADTDKNNIAGTGFDWNSLKTFVAGMPANIMFIVDTCHSGNVWGNMSIDRNAVIGAVKDLDASGSRFVIMTAATSDDSSFEDASWGHGAFTFAVIEAIEGKKADFDRDQTVTMKELDLYVSQRVKSITNGLQRPTTIIPDSVPDFTVASL